MRQYIHTDFGQRVKHVLLLLLAVLVCLPLTAQTDEDYYGVNLVHNGTFDDGTGDWREVSEQGSEIRYEIGSESNTSIRRYLHLGSQLNTFKQGILLTESFTEKELDASPVAFVSCDVMHNYGYHTLKVFFYFLAENGDTLATKALVDLTNTYQAMYYKDWYSLQGELTVPKGARIAVVTLSGSDGPLLAGYHGPGFDNVKLVIERPGTVRAKHKITATSNRPDKEKMFGSGEFWEGSTVFISALHDMPSYMGSAGFSDHGCGLQFDGYADISNFKTSRALRDITVGTADTTYTALFKIKNTASLSQTSYRIERAKPETFTEPTLTLPDGYTGKVTWVSGNNQVATVDSETGKVNYEAGLGSGRLSVTITAILPADDNYTGTKLSYVIYYYGKSTYFGQNLVENGDFSNDKDGWTQTEKSDSIATDNLTPGIGKYLHAGYSSVSYQCVDLSPMFLDSELDAEPRAYISFDYNCSRYMNEQKVKVTYLTAVPSGIVHPETLATTTHLNKYSGKSGNEEPTLWQTYQDVDTIPAGTRAVKIEIWGKGYGSGQDSVDGPGFDNISFVVRPADEEVKTTNITVTTNKDSETAYGSGTYWQGSTVLIGTGHDLYGHSCENNFSGYDGEDEPEKLTTQRAITVPAEATTYRASFKEPLTASFSQACYRLDINNLSVFQKPYLSYPSDYRGGISYSSSRPYLATVHESWGNVTYVGDGLVSSEPVYITATFSGDDKYEATSVHYSIYYGQALGGQELITNGKFDFGQWGWTVEEGSFMTVTDSVTEGIGKFFHAGAGTKVKLTQTIDLVANGIPAETCDTYPKSYFSIDHRTRQAKTCEKITVQYIDYNDWVQKECKYVADEYDFCLVGSSPWQTIQDRVSLPLGTRTIKIILEGQAYASGSGMSKTIGPDFDNVSLRILPTTSNIPTHNITVTTNLTDSTEVTYGSGSYWEGSTVYIGTVHDGNDHTCKHFFTGYSHESNPQHITTQRAITIGKTDTAYVANFADPAFSETSVAVLWNEADKFKEPTILNLPSWYTSKPEYSSTSNPTEKEESIGYYWVKVDPATGKVTYNSYHGVLERVPITAVLPPEGHFAGDTLEYEIYFAGEIETINSKDDWDKFRKNYKHDYPVYVCLGADITLGNKDYIDKFEGIFDGRGHTLNLDLSTRGVTSIYNYGPFYNIYDRAIMKNLNIKANIIVDDYDNDMGCLVTYLDGGTLDIVNCHCHANIFVDSLDSYIAAWPGVDNSVGGFVGRVKENSVLNFKDCSFEGYIVVKYTNDDEYATFPHPTRIGGFVAELDYSEKKKFISPVRYTNCLSYMKLNVDKDSYLKPYCFDNVHCIKSYRDYVDVQLENCYYRNVPYEEGRIREDGTAYMVYDEQVANGEATYRLNNGRAGDQVVWTQTIGTDTTPQLKTISPESLEVFWKGADATTVGTAGWSTLYYPSALTMPKGVKAYTVSGVKDGCAVLEEVPLYDPEEEETIDVPARTPIIVCTLSEGKTETDALTIPLRATYYNKVNYTGASILKGVWENTDAQDGWYIMQKQNGEVAFWQVDTSVAQPYVPAWRCHLELPAAMQTNSRLKLGYDSETTGIDTANAETLEPLLRNGAVYDLEGRKVKNLQKGQIYIKNGRKFIVK